MSHTEYDLSPVNSPDPFVCEGPGCRNTATRRYGSDPGNPEYYCGSCGLGMHKGAVKQRGDRWDGAIVSGTVPAANPHGVVGPINTNVIDVKGQGYGCEFIMADGLECSVPAIWHRASGMSPNYFCDLHCQRHNQVKANAYAKAYGGSGIPIIGDGIQPDGGIPAGQGWAIPVGWEYSPSMDAYYPKGHPNLHSVGAKAIADDIDKHVLDSIIEKQPRLTQDDMWSSDDQAIFRSLGGGGTQPDAGIHANKPWKTIPSEGEDDF